MPGYPMLCCAIIVVMACSAMLCCAVLCNAASQLTLRLSTFLCYKYQTILRYTRSCNAILGYTRLCHTILSYTIQCNATLRLHQTLRPENNFYMLSTMPDLLLAKYRLLYTTNGIPCTIYYAVCCILSTISSLLYRT